MRTRFLGSCWLLLLGVLACESPAPPVEESAYLFIGTGRMGYDLRFGDVLSPEAEGLRYRNLLDGRDTLVNHSLGDVRTTVTLKNLVDLGGTEVQLDTQQLVRQPYRYTYGSTTYWASFEPTFTGFPEFARTGSRDFINHALDWAADAPGLIYSEYVLVNNYRQPILVFGARRRGQYADSHILVVDSVGAAQSFAGRRYDERNGEGGRQVSFTALPTVTTGLSLTGFIQSVNEGYTRSYLLNDPLLTDFKPEPGLPRRAIIDSDDLGEISAGFLSNSEFILLSDDHVILQGSYVLDLDKGVLTVRDAGEVNYRLFVSTGDTTTFTVPVSVVELVDGELRGADNYLRLEVVD